MSVINKMLRDLDARRATALPAREAAGGVMGGTASVKGRAAAGAGRAGLGRLLPLALMLGLAAAVVWRYLPSSEEPPPAVKPVPQAPVSSVSGVVLPAATASAVVAPAPAVAGAAPAPALGSQQLQQMLDQAAAGQPMASPPPGAQPMAGITPAQAQQMMQQLSRSVPGNQLPQTTQPPALAHELQQQLARPAVPLGQAAALPTTRPAVAAQTAPASRPPRSPLPMNRPEAGAVAPPAPWVAPPATGDKGRQAELPREEVLSGSPPAVAAVHKATASKAAAAKSSRPDVTAPQSDPRQVAALETLTQARTLWDAGSREPALEMMRQAVAVAERAYASRAEPAALPPLHSLLRELVRMELAEGYVKDALDRLVRLEPLIAEQADLWAMRGNAAQRLGRHADSVQAYQMALKLHPGEPRWLLALAVSMAAQGQLSAAAEQAEKARAAGAVSPDVLAYLKQLGVPLR